MEVTIIVVSAFRETSEYIPRLLLVLNIAVFPFNLVMHIDYIL